MILVAQIIVQILVLDSSLAFLILKLLMIGKTMMRVVMLHDHDSDWSTLATIEYSSPVTISVHHTDPFSQL